MSLQELNTGPIYTNSNCIGCNKCISACGTAGANVVVQEDHSDQYMVAVDSDKCILCGCCIAECLHNARTYKDDAEAFFEDLARGEEISILVAPSLLSNYEAQYNNILGYLKHLGAKHIYNTSFGADIMVWAYINFIQNFNLKGVISQFCPVIVNYLEKYKPELLDYLMPVQSPMMCTAIYVSDYLKVTDKLAYISPCIASKHEIDDINTYGKVRYNVTLEHLRSHLENMNMTSYFAADEMPYGLGGLISMSGGISDNIELFVGFDETLIQTTGPRSIFPYFDHYLKEIAAREEVPFMVDALNCTDGCNFGTGTSCGVEYRNKIAFSAHRAKENAYKSGNVPSGSHYSERIQKLNERFKDIELCSFVRQYGLTRKVRNKVLSEEEFESVYQSMYKYTDKERHTDCGSCGYRTCRNMAYAIATNANHKENCINYAKKRIKMETEKTNALLEEISSMNKELKSSAQLKSNFLANMSHEIRTPMNAVIGMAEMALRGNLGDEERNYIQQIKSSGRSLLAIINDVLDFSKIESGKLEIINTEYAVMSIINDTINMVMARIGEKDITFLVDVDPSIPFKLFGDDIRIKQIIVNLAGNAVKFTASGFVELSMHYENQGEELLLSVAVADSGIGIKQMDLDHIFTSFQQVDSTRNRSIEGTGLGLAISREFVRLMDGKIQVESTYGKGSTFSFQIPQKIIDSAPSVTLKKQGTVKTASCIQNKHLRGGFEKSISKLAVEDVKCSALKEIEKAVAAGAAFVFLDYPLWDEAFREYARQLKTAQFIIIVDPRKDIVAEPYVRKLNQPIYSLSIAAALNNEREKFFKEDFQSEWRRFEAPDAQILIVDDNAINLTVAKGLLSPLHMNITTASGALEALRLVEDTRYDIILMDHMMPDIDGVEATHRIREKEGDYYKNLPIIALTANAINNAREMFLSEGMNDFVAKPIDMTDIASKIKKWLPPWKVIPAGASRMPAAQEEARDIPDIAGLDVKAGLALAGTWEFYKKILADYYAAIEKKAAIIEQYEENGDILNYTIEVHSLKSVSRIIGACELSDMAAELEACGKQEDLPAIKAGTPALLRLYRSYLPVLLPYSHVDAVEALYDITDAKLDEKLTALYGSLDNFDIDAAMELVKDLQSFRFCEDWNALLEKLHAAVKDLEYEDASALAQEWKALLKS